ncbi:two-component system sensor histidine kinase CreC [Pseudomonadota bacterium]
MSLGLRIFLVYILFVGLSGYFILNTVMDEIRPGVRQSTEETLVDTANLLAEFLREDVKAGTLFQSDFSQLLKRYGQRDLQANIWGIEKSGVNNRIYVTDRNGVVLLDSSGEAVGEDYSRWNDVYLTLRGQYGARSTTEVSGDERTTVMYVAAPIIDDGMIIGAVTVAKPNSMLQPYIDQSQRRLSQFGIGLVVLGLVIGGLLSWWLSAALRRLTTYAQTVSEGQRGELPSFRGGELAQLTSALEHMRIELEGKSYVERYVQTLTHELKSPLAAIRGATELLQNDMPAEQRNHFIANIDNESIRLQQLIERLLSLALVEQRQSLEEHEAIPLHEIVESVLDAQSARVYNANLEIKNEIEEDLCVSGERFLLHQALTNLFDNALDFTPDDGLIRFSAGTQDKWLRLSVFNQGDAIPDYALTRLTERFYSLPRPGSGRKSTGLGLNFVEEVVQLHGGSLEIQNVESGVEVLLVLPAK